jgi:hypothetical protein
MRRTLALCLVLFGAYAATLGIEQSKNQLYAGDEPHYLLAAESIVSDGDVDLRDEYAHRDYADFHDGTLARHGKFTEGRLNEPHGFGFPLLIAPAYALGGAKGVELFLAALLALGVGAAYRIALRVTPDPWAIGAAATVGLSAPFIAYGTTIYPDMAAAAILAGAALLALRLDLKPQRREAFPCFALLGSLPFLGPKFLPAAVIIGFVAARGMWRARRRTLAVGSMEVAFFGFALLVGLNEALYGGLTPYSSATTTPTGLDSPGDVADRGYRLIALFVDRDLGLLRWAPFFALAFAGIWWLWRSRRDHLARAVPGVRDVQLTAELCAAVLAVQLLVAAFLAPTLGDAGFPGRQLLPALPLAIPLCAWGLRHAPKTGAVLALLTLGGSAWLYAHARAGGSFLSDRPDAPFGPLTNLLPRFTDGSDWPYWLAAGIAVGVAALVVREATVMRESRAIGVPR